MSERPYRGWEAEPDIVELLEANARAHAGEPSDVARQMAIAATTIKLLRAERERLRALLLELSEDRPGFSSHLAVFERLAQQFYDETGIMAPGKSVPVPMCDRWRDGEREDAWRKWLTARREDQDARISEALEEEKP